ncbi:MULTISPECIES: hypothetical protein [unclassified Paenibacillus]|uniref:hypothetical protein n=1 Tax=unclassified Paenibacillus TaxID=185978 RepID=UPI0036283D8D
MLTYGICGAIVISSGLIERKARENGNVTGALAAQRFGRFFLIGAGGWIAWEWISGMLALV